MKIKYMVYFTISPALLTVFPYIWKSIEDLPKLPI